MARHVITMKNEGMRAKLLAWANRVPVGYRVEFKEPKRSLEQNDRMWEMLDRISKRFELGGRKFEPDEWKCIFLKAMGKEVTFLPTLDEQDVLLQVSRIPGTSVDQSQAMQFDVEKAVGKVPEVKLVFSRTGTAELASDPMPPNLTDTFVIVKDRSQWPNPSMSKADLVEKIEHAVADIPGQNYELTQPIQMRFNELLAGVRGDIAVKVYGDDFATMLKTADKVADQLRVIEGAVDVRVEQVQGMPLLDAQLDRDAMARVGLTAKDVFDTLAAAVAGREAGHIFEGDRRFDVVVRMGESARNDVEALRQLPVLTPGGKFVPLGSVARLELGKGPSQISRENGKRRVVVQANVRGRDIAGVVKDAQNAIDAKVTRPPGVWLTWAGSSKIWNAHACAWPWSYRRASC